MINHKLESDAMNKVRIAIDGPGGAGKSTIAKEIAKNLNIEYIDTGAMYRSIAYKLKEKNCTPADKEKIKEILENTEVDFKKGEIYLDGINLEGEIRTQEISLLASEFSQNKDVRIKLVELQKAIANAKSVVMDGRDIGTNVIKDAELKIYLTASVCERAKRRFEELSDKGEKVKYQDILIEMQERDSADMNRELNPLKQADDAQVVDTTGKNIEEVVDEIMLLLVKK